TVTYTIGTACDWKCGPIRPTVLPLESTTSIGDVTAAASAGTETTARMRAAAILFMAPPGKWSPNCCALSSDIAAAANRVHVRSVFQTLFTSQIDLPTCTLR